MCSVHISHLTRKTVDESLILRSSKTANTATLALSREWLLQKSPRVSRVAEVKEVVKFDLEDAMLALRDIGP